MADNLSPLVNLDLINKIYRTINAQITERVYDPLYYPEATLGSEDNKYVEAYIRGNTSTGTLNGLTLAKATAGFTISGGETTSRTLTVADMATITKSLEVAAATSIKSNLTVSAATNIVKGLTVGTTDTGAVTIRSNGANPTTITGPDNLEAVLINGTYTTSATTENNTTPEVGKLLKIKSVDAKTFLAGPATGAAAAPDYRSIVASDLPKELTNSNAATASQVKTATVSTDTKYYVSFVDSNNPDATAEKVYTNSKLTYNPFTGTLSATSFNGIAAKTAHSISVKDGATTPVTAIDSWNGSDDKTLTIKGNSPVTTTATTSTGTITITHDKKGPTVAISGGDTDHQAPGFGGTFKVTSATVDEYGHTTAFAEHEVTIPNSTATKDADGLMSSTDKEKLDGVASGAEVNQNAFSNITVGSTTISADLKTDTLTLAAGNNITLTPDTENDKITVSSSYIAASGSVSGIVTTGDQVFAGIKTFNSTEESSDTTSGAVIISGGLGVAKHIYAGAVHNAVWNDLVDCMEVPEDTSLEFGYCYSWEGTSVVKSSRSSKNCIGIHSNTAGFAMGEKKTKTIRAAVAGFVLAYTDKSYPEGTPLTWGDDGVLTKCGPLKKILHPERIIATFYREEKEEEWHNLPVLGRHWVKIV